MRIICARRPLRDRSWLAATGGRMPSHTPSVAPGLGLRGLTTTRRAASKASADPRSGRKVKFRAARSDGMGAADHKEFRVSHSENDDAPEGLQPIVDEFNGWLGQLAASDGSDLHVKAGGPPKMRETGRLRRMDRDPLTAADAETIARAIIPGDRIGKFDEKGE